MSKLTKERRLWRKASLWRSALRFRRNHFSKLLLPNCFYSNQTIANVFINVQRDFQKDWIVWIIKFRSRADLRRNAINGRLLAIAHIRMCSSKIENLNNCLMICGVNQVLWNALKIVLECSKIQGVQLKCSKCFLQFTGHSSLDMPCRQY